MRDKKLAQEEQERLNEELFIAVKKGNLYAVKSALKDGADINAKDKDGHTPLHDSSFPSCPIEITKYLLKSGANINAQSNHGSTSLHIATCYEDIHKIRLFFEYKADMYLRTHRNSFADPGKFNSDNNGSPFKKALERRLYDIAELFIFNGYIPCEEDFDYTLTPTEGESLKKRFMTLTEQVQKQRAKLKEEVESQEFTYAVSVKPSVPIPDNIKRLNSPVT